MAERPLMLAVSESQEPDRPPVSGLCSEMDLAEVRAGN